MNTRHSTNPTKVEQARTARAIQTAEQAYDSMLQRQIDELCNRQHEEPDTFEFQLLEKTYQLYYGGEGRLPTFTKAKQPKDIHFIESITKLEAEGMYQLTTRAVATSEYIRKELERLEIPVDGWRTPSSAEAIAPRASINQAEATEPISFLNH